MGGEREGLSAPVLNDVTNPHVAEGVEMCPLSFDDRLLLSISLIVCGMSTYEGAPPGSFY